MRDDLGDQLALLGGLVALRTAERLAAHVDLALLADHDGEPFGKVPFLGPLQHQPAAVERAFDAAFPELARRRHIRLVEAFEEHAGRLAPLLPVRFLLGPSRLQRGERLVDLGHRSSPLPRQPTEPSRLIEISFCASTANSIGSCCSTSRTKPLTTSATASSCESPRCMQ